MRLRTAAKGAVVAGFAVAVVVIGASKSLDTNRLRAFLASQVKAATGRDLTIAGSLRLKVGLVPVLIAEGVGLSNRPGGSHPEMLHIDRVEAELALLPLLKRDIRVVRLIVSAPRILLETDAHGRGNWIPDPAAAPATPDRMAAPRFNLRELKIKNAQVIIRDAGGGQSRTINIHKLAIQPERPGAGPMAVQMVGDDQGKGFEASGSLGSLADIGLGRPWPLQLKASGRGMQTAVSGTLGDPVSGRGIDLKLTAQGDEVADLAKLAGFHLQPMGPFRLSMKLGDAGGRLALSDVDATLGRRDTLFLSARGSVRDAIAATGLELAVSAESDNLAGMSRLLGTDIPSMGPLKAGAHLRGGAGDWRLNDLKASLAGSDLAGELSLRLTGRPHLVAQISATALALADFATPAPRPGEKLDVRSPPRNADGRLIPDLNLPLAALDGIDAEISAHVGTLALGQVRLVDTAIGMQLRQGNLTVSPLRAGLAGGALQGMAELRGLNRDQPTAILRIEGIQIDAGRLARESGVPLAVEGRIAFQADLSGRGHSLHTLLLQAHGSATARLDSPLLPTGNAATTVRCGFARLTIRDGIASAERSLGAEFDSRGLLGGGTIDLRTERLDLRLLPAGGGETIAVGGTLAEPLTTSETAPPTATADSPACQAAQGLAPVRTGKGRPSR